MPDAKGMIMKTRCGLWTALAAAGWLTLTGGEAAGAETAATTFPHPLLDSGPAPCTIFHGGA